MFDIIFFTSNLNINLGGLDLENKEEIILFEKNYKFLLLDYTYLDNVVNIVNSVSSIIIYIDFTNQDINLLKNISNLNNKIILKYKGYYLNDDIVKFLSSLRCDNTIYILTTSNNKDYLNVKFIKYWAMDLTILNDPIYPTKLIYSKDYQKFVNTSNLFTFIFIGRKDAHKGIFELVEMFKTVENARLIIIGLGKINSTNNNIIEFPYMPYKECLYMIKNYSDCLILPSKNEGFGRVAVEAIFYNKLVIMTKYTMLYDVVNQIDNPIFFYENNNEILKLINHIKDVEFNYINKTKVINFVNNSFDKFIYFFNNDY